MTRGNTLKFDESVFQKPNYWGKIFMYNSACWNILYPIADLIRIFPKPMIITHVYKKNQHNIKLYGSQYNHSVMGIDLKYKNDYIQNLKMVKFVFIFSDVQDPFADNIIKYCKTSKTPLICYSSIDKLYHFYDTTKITLKDASEVILKMEEIKEKNILNKLDELFPEFEILDVPFKQEPILENCLKILKRVTLDEEKKKVFSTKLPFDANFNKMKPRNKVVIHDDELPVNRPQSTKQLLSQFFKKN